MNSDTYAIADRALRHVIDKVNRIFMFGLSNASTRDLEYAMDAFADLSNVFRNAILARDHESSGDVVRATVYINSLLSTCEAITERR